VPRTLVLTDRKLLVTTHDIHRAIATPLPKNYFWNTLSKVFSKDFLRHSTTQKQLKNIGVSPGFSGTSKN
jgi:hypothetical protein